MRSTSMLPILLISSIIVSTHQAQNPTCQPATSGKTYEKTLIVFVVDSGTMNVGIKYVLQQLACTIPEADNLKTYILDYTDENVALPSSESAFSSSKDLSGKIATSLTGAISTDPCPRMNKVHKKFSEQAVVGGFTKVKYLAINMDTECDPPTGATDNWFKIFMKYDPTLRMPWYVQDKKRMDLLETGEVNAPQFLKDASNKLIGQLLGDASLGQSAAAGASASTSGDKSDGCLVAYGLAGVAGLVAVIGIGVLAALLLKEKNKGKTGKDHEKGKKGKKSKEGKKKPEDKTPTTTDEQEDSTPNQPSMLADPIKT